MRTYNQIAAIHVVTAVGHHTGKVKIKMRQWNGRRDNRFYGNGFDCSWGCCSWSSCRRWCGGGAVTLVAAVWW